jgi:hypothetical protein
MQAPEFMERFNGYTIVRATEALMPDLSKLFLLTHNVKIPVTYFIRKFETNVIAEKYIGYFAYAPNGDVAAFYAVFPVILSNGVENVIACQSGDTITSPVHQKKGLFVELAKRTYALAKSLDVKIVFGFPNNNSSRGLFQNLGWTNLGRFNDYHIEVNSSNLFNYCHKYSLTAPLYHFYFSLIHQFIGIQSMFHNSCIDSNRFGVLHNQQFFEYKKLHKTYFVHWKGFDLWIKFDDGLYIGDIGLFDLDKDTDSFKTALVSLAKLLGVKNIRTSCSPGVFCDNLFSRITKSTKGLEIGILPLNKSILVTNIGFVVGDADTF